MVTTAARTQHEHISSPGRRIRVDGKQFADGGGRFHFRGATYGTFLPRPEDGALFPDRDMIKRDLAAMVDAGFTVVRTYTAPTDDLLEIADDVEIGVFAGIHYDDWRYLVGASRRQSSRMLADAAQRVRDDVRRVAESGRVVAVCLGNEVPADVVRWIGTDRVGAGIERLAGVVRDEDPSLLVTYANYPTAEYLPLDCLDFLTWNVYLEDRTDLRRYLTRLQNLAGDRPVVLGEIGLHAGGPGGEQRQADHLDWQLETALERGIAGWCVYSWTDEWAVGGQPVEGWHFGITRADRSPRPALDIVETWNRMTVADLRDTWPSLSVVICAYNAGETLDECLRHTVALDYPDLEIVVVDDGSTDDTAEIAARYPRARLVSIEHAGLSVARNAGLRAATGSIVAYLDSDAYPTPEWPYHLVGGFDSRDVGGAGGPNVPPPDDPIGAHRVALAPGGPVHVLVTDDRAEHVPGCNMAFWRDVLVDVGGFDPIYTSAGDDVDVCWKVLDRGWDIGFHPAALVWHHRRPGLRAYLKQQRGYGRSEALVEARHPDRFTPAGSARWRGFIYNPLVPRVGKQRIYRGVYGTAAYQSVYRGGGHAVDLAHQVGVPIACVLLATVVGVVLSPWLAMPAAAAAAFLLALAAIDAARATPPRHLARDRLDFRLSVAAHHLLQPIVRTWGRLVTRQAARGDLPLEPIDGPVRIERGVVVLPAMRPRDQLVATIVDHLRASGLRSAVATGWEPYDVRLLGSTLVAGELLTSAFPEGAVQLRVRQRVRRGAAAALAAVSSLALLVQPVLALALGVAAAASIARGLVRTGPRVRQILRRAAA